MVSYKKAIQRIKEIKIMHDGRKCIYCGGSLDPHQQCYSCHKYVYDAEYWNEIDLALKKIEK